MDDNQKVKTANLIDAERNVQSTQSRPSFKPIEEEVGYAQADGMRSSQSENNFSTNQRYNHDPECPPYDDEILTQGINFSEKSIRAGFIKRVYSILTIQLLFTFGLVAVFTINEGVQGFFQQNPLLIFVPAVGSFFLICVISCSENARRQAPANIIILVLFTICYGLMVAFVASTYDRDSVFFCVALTAGIVFLLTAFAFQTRIDFTKFGPALILVFLVFAIASIGVAIVKGFQDDSYRFYLAVFGALLFSLFIIYDTQMMMGGNHKYSISPEEYVYAALVLYLDIMRLFLYLLRIFGQRR